VLVVVLLGSQNLRRVLHSDQDGIQASNMPLSRQHTLRSLDLPLTIGLLRKLTCLHNDGPSPYHSRLLSLRSAEQFIHKEVPNRGASMPSIIFSGEGMLMLVRTSRCDQSNRSMTGFIASRDIEEERLLVCSPFCIESSVMFARRKHEQGL
jgi:hypothetical protein